MLSQVLADLLIMHGIASPGGHSVIPGPRTCLRANSRPAGHAAQDQGPAVECEDEARLYRPGVHRPA
jgi:hypothetical protein